MPHIPGDYSIDLNSPPILVFNPAASQQKTAMLNAKMGRRASAGGLAVPPAKCRVSCIEEPPKSTKKAEEKTMELMEGVEYPSRPPSPPSSGSQTPTNREPEIPERWRPMVPPPNYGATKSGNLFRSAFPHDRNLTFLKSLGVRNILCLVDTEPSEAYSHWVRTNGIRRHRVDIKPNKRGMETTWDSLCEALLILMDSGNYPLYVHCNQGRHRTGCVVACLRKVHRWPLDDILAEYAVYANPKARTGDVELIKAFDPDYVFEYAKRHGYLDSIPFMRRADSTIANIDALAEALSSKVPYCCDIDISGAPSNASTLSDDGLEMSLAINNGTSPPDEVLKRPSLQRMFSGSAENVKPGPDGVEHAQAGEAGDEAMIDPVFHGEGTTITAIELTEDRLTPPPDCFTAKMLSAA